MMSRDEVVLILTQQIDFHADMIIRELRHREIEVVRFNTADFPLRSTLTAYHRNGEWDTMLSVDGRVVRFVDVKSIVYRRPTPFEVDQKLTPAGQQFAVAEARMAIGGLLRSLDCLWVNHPERMVTAEYKPLQLRVAGSCGLEVPPSLITNDPEAVTRFFEECNGEMIYKTLSGGMIISEAGEPVNIYTSRVTAEDLQAQSQIQHTACLFQTRVPKKIELRITIIGDRVFAAEIYSQQSERTAIDWRRSYPDLGYGVHQLPAEIQEKCLLLMRHFGLAFGAIDMILTPDDRYVFLELNPNGQWGWIEHATGLPLCATLVDLLTKDSAS